MQEQPQQRDEGGALAPASAELPPNEIAGDEAELFVTQAEYARHRGCSRAYVSKLVTSEKIPIVLGSRGEILIDVVKADLALGENVERLDEPREAEAPTADTKTLTKHRATTEEYRAKMARLVYEQRLGKVLPIDQVEESCTAFGEAIMRLVHTLPMFAEELTAAGAKDGIAGMRVALRGVERTLLQRIGAACEELAKKATTAAAADDDGELADDEIEAAA